MDGMLGFKIYLGGPIFDVEDGNEWRCRFRQAMNARGYEGFFLDPMRGKLVKNGMDSNYNSKEVIGRDIHDITHADLNVSYLPYGVQTIGTPMELVYAKINDIPSIVISASERIRAHYWVQEHSLCQLRTFDEAADYIMTKMVEWW